MRLHLVLAALLGAVFLTLSPARAEDPAPLRHLEYRVSVHSTGTTQSESYDGLSTDMATGGYDGTLSVDVLAVAKDGGMVVKGAEWMHGRVRPEQAVTCAVYGDGRVICPQNAPLTGTIHILFSHLGRTFYDTSLIDANGKWTRSDEGPELSVKSTFAQTPTQNADIVMIREHTDVAPRQQIAVGFSSDTDIRYNTTLLVPVSIHDVSTTDSRSGSAGGTDITDLNLTKDSFAH